MKVRAAFTVTGLNKENCQDAIRVEELEEENPAILFALSDGAGSAPYGKEGAEFIVSTFVDTVRTRFRERQYPGRVPLRTVPLLQTLLESLRDTREELVKKSLIDGIHPEDLNATFIGGILFQDFFGETGLIYLSVGDSVLIAFDENFEPIHVNPITIGEYPNTTVFLSSPEFGSVLTVGVVENPGWVFVSSDGLDGVFFRQKLISELERKLPHYEKFMWRVDPYPNLITLIEKLSLGKIDSDGLREFLQMEKVSQLNGDDKSLIILEVKDGGKSSKTNGWSQLISGRVGERKEGEADSEDCEWGKD
jgi:hypothetical protein